MRRSPSPSIEFAGIQPALALRRPSLLVAEAVAFVIRWAIAALSIAWLPTRSFADPIYDRETNVAVRDRDHPEYDPLGITAGIFRVFPRVAAGVVFDDNIYAVNAKTSDFVFDLHPAIDIRSLWSRNEVRLNIDYEADRYISHPAQDTQSYSGDLTGRLDIDRDSSLTIDLSAARAIQPRISQNSIAGVLTPVRYDLTKGDLTGFRVFDRIKTTFRLEASHYNYDNTLDQSGAPVQEDYQDHDEFVATTRADYALSPATVFFVEGSLNDHPYRLEPPLAPFRRDSHGYDVLAGVEFAATHLIGGTIGVGYQSQRYTDPQFDGVNGLALRGALEILCDSADHRHPSGKQNLSGQRPTERRCGEVYRREFSRRL